MSAAGLHTAPLARVAPMPGAGRRALRLVERNAFAYRRNWKVFLTGFLEPFLYLLSIGVGVGGLVADLPGPRGATISYEEFVAPGLLAAAAMNGAVFDTTFNFFVKFKYARTYDAIVATPLGVGDVAAGEVAWGLLRAAIYSTAFLFAMVAFGLVSSWWAVLVVPAATVIGFGFAGCGLAGASRMRSFVDFDYVNLAIVPLFLFSATFFPLERYPGWLQVVVQVTPLYQGVELIRSLVLGDVRWGLLVHVAYLLVMGVLGARYAARHLARRLQP